MVTAFVALIVGVVADVVILITGLVFSADVGLPCHSVTFSVAVAAGVDPVTEVW